MIENMNKATLIELCRRVGIKTGDTARNPRGYYAEALATHNEPEAVEAAIASFHAPAMALIGAVPKPVEHPEGIRCIAQRTAKELFGVGGAIGKIVVDVWNDPSAEEADPDYRFNAKYLAKVLAALKRGQNIWLYGPAGTGKTEFVRNLAAHLGRAFYRVSFDSAMERYEYIGGERVRAGTTVWQDGIILQAMTRPGAIVLLDEVGFARPEYTSPLHPVLEPHGKVTITETGRIVAKAPGVQFFAADNSNGSGDSVGSYVGVRQQNRAFLSRFGAFVSMDYLPAAEEAAVIALRTGCNEDLANVIVGFLTVCRSAAGTAIIEEAPSLREAFALAGLLMEGLDVRDAFEVAVIDRCSAQNAESMQQLYKQNIDPGMWLAAVEGNLASFNAAANSPPPQPEGWQEQLAA